MRHRELCAAILLNAPSTATLFNNPGGVASYGNHRVRYGLVKGAADIVGWTCVNGVAVFTALEIKGEKDKPRSVQHQFLSKVARDGGIAAVVRSLEDLPAVFSPQRIAKREVYGVDGRLLGDG